ncbi:MAG: hypothetical protein GY754_12105 [bacterium]|nr:hypothetical protein [bacterium]
MFNKKANTRFFLFIQCFFLSIFTAFVFTGCGGEDEGGGNDNTAPTTGTVTATNVTTTSMTLNWTKASDTATADGLLEYKVVYSTSDNISTAADAETTGGGRTVLQDWTTDINTIPVTGLTSATVYYFAVLVRDEAELKAIYTTLSQGTALQYILGSEVEFADYPTSGIEKPAAVALSNGNVLIAYEDNQNNCGKFVIYDASGTVVKTETQFEASDIGYSTAVQLSGGNVLIAYNDAGDSNKGKFVMVDSSGTAAVSETEFSAGQGIRYLSAAALQNGNVLIAYEDNDTTGDPGYFVIYNASGGIVKSPTRFDSGTNSSGIEQISAATFSNGYVMIAFQDDDDGSKGKFVILDSSGNSVVGETSFSGDNIVQNPSLTPLQNGNMMIAYENDTNASDIGEITVYNTSGEVVVSPTQFDSGGDVSDVSATTLKSGNVLIAYRDGTSSDYGSYVIISSSGSLVKTETVFSGTNVTKTPSATCLSGGKALIAYEDDTDGDKGTFKILD